MSLRDPQALLGTFTRAGVLCLAPGGRTCVAHGLPSTPDWFNFTELVGTTALASFGQWLIESWDSVSIVFVNSIAQGVRGYMIAQMIWSPQL